MHGVETTYNQIITARYTEATKKELGREDILTIPSNIETHSKEWGYVFFPESFTHIDTLIIFVHGGIRVPTGFEHLISTNTLASAETLATTIQLNVDLGSALLASTLLSQLNHQNSTAIAWYDYARVVGDANRVRAIDQLPAKPYKGESPWSEAGQNISARKAILKKTVLPFFSDMLQLVKKYKPALIVSPHTYDQTSGGTTTAGVSDLVAPGNERPAGMIFQKNTSRAPNADFTLLPAAHIDQIQSYLSEALKTLSTFKDKTVEVGIDYPYVIPLLFPLWLKMAEDAHHLMFEVRKDAFVSISDADLDKLVDFIYRSQKELLPHF